MNACRGENPQFFTLSLAFRFFFFMMGAMSVAPSDDAVSGSEMVSSHDFFSHGRQTRILAPIVVWVRDWLLLINLRSVQKQHKNVIIKNFMRNELRFLIIIAIASLMMFGSCTSVHEELKPKEKQTELTDAEVTAMLNRQLDSMVNAIDAKDAKDAKNARVESTWSPLVQMTWNGGGNRTLTSTPGKQIAIVIINRNTSGPWSSHTISNVNNSASGYDTNFFIAPNGNRQVWYHANGNTVNHFNQVGVFTHTLGYRYQY
ncbi:MAG: hypothetical protein NZL83_04890 [Candidatus Absconditabacterales bacterium]|nr:hypothetical protein [Candidatus Absconditabacterales bacterium]